MNYHVRMGYLVERLLEAISFRSGDSLALARRLALISRFPLTAAYWRRVGRVLGKLQDRRYIKLDAGAFVLTARGRSLLDARLVTLRARVVSGSARVRT